MLRPLYDAVLRLSAHRRAGWVLGAVSFIESSVFPVPPDLLLVPMIFSARARAWTLAAITTITSALGALLGYAIGALFWDTLGSQIVFLYGGQEAFDSFQAFYVEWGLLVLLAAAVTFLPFKIATIASGVAGLPLFGFFVTSLVGRGLRFYLVAAGAYYLGPGMRRQFERNFARMSAVTGVLALALLVYLFLRH
ncbi:MAG: YqaA family protein [Pseudomonadota bacterium]|nr:YqaA family protein [Pseudomonadota bacterium]